jgi:hypothetical protein
MGNDKSWFKPQLFADITLYPTDQGGRLGPIVPGSRFGCPYKFDPKDHTAWDGWIFPEEPFAPGQTKRLGIHFLSADIAAVFRLQPKFFLWEGRIIGEAVSASLS